jgi:uncharacterized protein YrzB (UPF0473 family)
MLASDLHLEIAKIPIKAEDTEGNENAIIKHNNYLYLIARNNDEQAMKILRCETDNEIEKYVKEYLVIPPELKKADPAKLSEIVKDTIQEVKWVHEYCSRLPREVNQSAMMAAYPDNETCYDIVAKIQGECEIEAKASSQFNIITMFMIIGGIVMISGLVEIITIVLLA